MEAEPRGALRVGFGLLVSVLFLLASALFACAMSGGCAASLPACVADEVRYQALQCTRACAGQEYALSCGGVAGAACDCRCGDRYVWVGWRGRRCE